MGRLLWLQTQPPHEQILDLGPGVWERLQVHISVTKSLEPSARSRSKRVCN